MVGLVFIVVAVIVVVGGCKLGGWLAHQFKKGAIEVALNRQEQFDDLFDEVWEDRRKRRGY